MNVDKKILVLNEKIGNMLFDKEAVLPIGLAYGKMGICIYFYHYARITQEKKYEKIADKLLDQIYSKIDTAQGLNIEHGVLGVGLGIDYLINRKYVSGNINTILEEIDNKVFRLKIQEDSVFETKGYLQLLFYMLIRLRKQKKGSDNEFIYREFIIQIVNKVSLTYNESLFETSASYSIYFELPIFLYVLGEVYKENFYNQKILKILEDMHIKVVSLFPTMHANRLFLLWGILKIKQSTQLNVWDDHIDMLSKHIDSNWILTDELKDRDVAIESGAAGIYLLLKDVNRMNSGIVCYDENIVYQKIVKSSVWKTFESEKTMETTSIGIFAGFCGISYIISELENNISFKNIR